MALVDYSSDDDEEEGEKEQEQDHEASRDLKRKHGDTADLPPLPSRFHDLYASTSRVSTTDDPSLHGGRKRVTPHIEEYEILGTLISSIKSEAALEVDAIKTLLTSDLGAPLPLHISLSRSIGLATVTKDAFTTSLERKINISNIRPFPVGFSGLDWVPNYEKTRWFLVLRVGRPAGNGLNKLLATCNSVCQKYGQPALYAKIEESNSGSTSDVIKRVKVNSQEAAVPDLSDAFHVSIAWSLAQPSSDLVASTKSVLESESFVDVKAMQLRVAEIKAKVGNLVTNMRLLDKMQESKGLFGF